MILDELSNYARERVALAKEKECLESIKKRAMETKKGEHRFFAALEKENLRFICEVKKASPSKGIISEDFPYLEIAKAYEKAGAFLFSQNQSGFLEVMKFLKKSEKMCQLQ